ncbi:hypothetical protein QYE76_041010 [Lolium multiflorum]|uniref:CCHC-type domain-containing protein n=1 Tax=Lolium multiflorum TaxID=4521 RepID=A0AAD8WTA7_LOLMU|nr:hypothetical protein QYE76_041010 [Lolium multiflorum]
MGKKKGASASEAAKVSRDWSASAISNRDINKLRSLGFISASEDDIRLPALAAPELHPPSIHLVIVCEAFLGIDPHWGLWRKIFYVKRHNDSNGPPVVGGVGFVVRKEVDYLDYPMKESVQGWRNKWFYLGDPSISGRCSNLPPFEDKLIAKPKKSWQNTLSSDEKLTADRLFDQIVTLKNTGGLTMCGTEVVSVFLQRRVQPLMSRPHQLWLYSGKDDESRVSSADLSADDLRDEVRRLTCLSKNDNIVLISARPPYDADHPPTEALAAARCYPPTPESGVVLEDDDDDSDGTEDAPHVLEDSDVQEEEATEDDAFVRSRRRKQVHDDFIASAESSPQGGDNDADAAAAPPPAKKSSTNIFAGEDDLDLCWKPTGLPLNILLKEEVKKLKQRLKDEQDAKHAAAALIDKKEGALRESIKELLDAADLTVTRRHQLREDSIADALSLAAESNIQVLGLLRKAKGALSRLYSMIFPKMKEDKTLDDMAASFLVDPSEPVEVVEGFSQIVDEGGSVLWFYHNITDVDLDVSPDLLPKANLHATLVVYALEHFKSTYDNKGFTPSHCWMLLKDAKKWETSYVLWRKRENVIKKGNVNGNSSMNGTIDLKYDGQGLGARSTDEEGGGGHAKRPVGHKVTKTDMHHQTSSLAFQDTLRDLMVNKEEIITEREERLVEAEAKARLVDAEAKSKVLEAKAKSKVLEAEAKIMAEENQIMLTDLATISDPVERTWIKKKQKPSLVMIEEGFGIDECHLAPAFAPAIPDPRFSRQFLAGGDPHALWSFLSTTLCPLLVPLPLLRAAVTCEFGAITGQTLVSRPPLAPCFLFCDRRSTMTGKDKLMVQDFADGSSADRNLAIPPKDLPNPRVSSGSSQSATPAGVGGVADMLGRLQLTTQESMHFVLDDGAYILDAPEWALIGKVLAPNTLHISTIKSALWSAWGNPKGLEFRPMGANIFLAEFATEADKTLVQDGTPWTVGNHCVILNVWDPRVNPADVEFNELAFWARILKLPCGLMNDHRGKELASRLGKIERMVVDEKGRAWGEYLRVLSVMYERMPTFCFSCGLIGHSSLSCPTPAERDEDGLLPYHGPKLCVPDDRKKKQAGASSNQNSFSSGQGSWSGAGRGGQYSQPRSATERPGRDKDKGEFNSPTKPKKPRARKAKDTSVDDGNKSATTRAGGLQISGQKRKEYRPKSTPNLLLQGAVPINPTACPAVTEVGGEDG